MTGSKFISDQEAQFTIDELFFSHTDQRGIVQFGNDVFIRVSDFEAHDILGKPHNIIRHPDMPKCVFKLLWDHLLSNQAIVAYVKNRSKHGKFYWVLALAFPYSNGFLSIRLKPTTPLLKIVSELYRKILSYENSNGTDAALELLVNEIKALGFQDYRSFMLHSLAKEIEARALQLPRASQKLKSETLFTLSTHAEAIVKGISQVEKDIKTLQKQLKDLNNHCINLTIKAESYGHSGNTIERTAAFFSKWGNEIVQILNAFSNNQIAFSNALSAARESVNFSYLQTAMAEAFHCSEQKNAEYENGLNDLSANNIRVCKKNLSEMQYSYYSFVNTLRSLSESIIALKIVQLSGKIESSHLPDSGLSISATVDNMVEFIETTEKLVKELEKNAVSAGNNVDLAIETLAEI